MLFVASAWGADGLDGCIFKTNMVKELRGDKVGGMENFFICFFRTFSYLCNYSAVVRPTRLSVGRLGVLINM